MATLATDAAPPTGLALDRITMVACPAPSRKNAPVQSLARLLSLRLFLVVSNNVSFALFVSSATTNIQRPVSQLGARC